MTSNIMLHKLTRRMFLKATAATAAVVAVGDKLFGGPMSTLVENAAAAPMVTEDVWIPTNCRGCRENDPVRVHVVDGIAVKVAGIPGEPKNMGKACGRAQSIIEKPYNPYRVKAPMKRTNPERGLGVDPGWVEISWDEALNTVAERLKPILQDDPRQFMFCATFGTVSRGMVGPTFGTPNAIGWGPGEFCGGGEHLGWLRTLSDSAMGIDYRYCNYTIIFGTNARGLAKATPSQVRPYLDAKERGMKVVVIDPSQAFEARQADEWIPIRPATDQAFVLAMVNAMVNELGLYDVEYMKLSTNGPYLIGPDGWYVRSKTDLYEDETRKETLGKPLIWDPTDETAKVFDDETIQDFALEGNYTVDGVQCQPAFQIFKDFLKPYTAEWAEPITTVPAKTIRRIAKEFGEASQIGATMTFYDDPDGPYTVPYRPVGVGFGKGSQGHYHANPISRAICLLYIVTGASNVVGSTKGSGGVNTDPYAGPDGVIAAKSFTNYRFTFPPQRIDQYDMHPLAHSGGTHVAYGLLEPAKYHIEYEIKVMGIHFQNPLKSMYNALKTEAAMKKIPFIFAISYHFDEPTEMADIVLPEPSELERWGIFSARGRYSIDEWQAFSGRFTHIGQPVIKPFYNTKDSMQILMEIADRVGRLADWNNRLNSSLRLKDPYKLEPDRKYEWKDVIDRQLKTLWGDEYGLEWFKVNGFKGKPIQSQKAWYGYNKQPKTRYPVYDEYIKWVGEKYKADLKKNGIDIKPEVYGEFTALLPWKGRGPIDEAPAQYDLHAINCQEALNAMNMAMDMPWKVEYNQLFDPYTMVVWLNTEVAKKKGIKDGDLIKIESQFGFEVEGEAKVTEGLHPECVLIPGGFGNRSVNLNPIALLGTSFNWLVGSEEEHIDQLGGNIEGSPKVRIYKA